MFPFFDHFPFKRKYHRFSWYKSKDLNYLLEEHPSDRLYLHLTTTEVLQDDF